MDVGEWFNYRNDKNFKLKKEGPLKEPNWNYLMRVADGDIQEPSVETAKGLLSESEDEDDPVEPVKGGEHLSMSIAIISFV